MNTAYSPDELKAVFERETRMERDKVRKDEPSNCWVFLTAGIEGSSISIGTGNCSTRIAGNKPWGGGLILKSFQVSVADIISAVGEKEIRKALKELKAQS